MKKTKFMLALVLSLSATSSAQVPSYTENLSEISDLEIEATDVVLKKNEKAPYQGVLVHDEMYQYLRAEEVRAGELEMELIEEKVMNPKEKSNYLFSGSVGVLIGVAMTTLIYDRSHGEALAIPLSIGALTGGLIVWSFQ